MEGYGGAWAFEQAFRLGIRPRPQAMPWSLAAIVKRARERSSTPATMAESDRDKDLMALSWRRRLRVSVSQIRIRARLGFDMNEGCREMRDVLIVCREGT